MHKNDDAVPADERTFSFIIKIWLEVPAPETGQTTWRGHITHVPSGQRQYFQKLQDIAMFIAPYLERVGVRLGLYWRFKLWKKKTSHLAK